jgi:putative DNA primase/helicase
VSRVLGPDYAVQLAPNLLFHERKDGHPTGVADLYGKRFAATHELDAGTRLAEGLVKQITGGDRIRARRMREDFWEFEPTHTLFLCANTKPVIRGTDDGIWRRIRVIPFGVQIPREEQDAGLPARLAEEAPGILAWLVAGAKEWQAEGLADPNSVLGATSDYRQDSDVVGQFLSDRCRLADGSYVKARALYEAYVAWHNEALGGEPTTQATFGRRLSDRGLIRKKHGTYHWEGVELV